MTLDQTKELLCGKSICIWGECFGKAAKDAAKEAKEKEAAKEAEEKEAAGEAEAEAAGTDGAETAKQEE